MIKNWKHITATRYLDVAGFRGFINCISWFIIKSLHHVFVIIYYVCDYVYIHRIVS